MRISIVSLIIIFSTGLFSYDCWAQAQVIETPEIVVGTSFHFCATDGSAANNCGEGFHVSDQIAVTVEGWNLGLVEGDSGQSVCTSLESRLFCRGDVEFSGDLGNTSVDPNFAFVFGPGGSLQRGKCQLPFSPSFFFVPFFVTGYSQPGVHTITATLFECKADPNNPFNEILTGQILANSTISITVLPDKRQQQFVLFLGPDGSGNALVHNFDANTHSIPQPFVVKIGQQFPMEISPLNQDGSTGSPIVVTEEIEDAQVADSLQGSSIPGPVVTLFKDKVLLHFAKSQSETHHDYFAIHSGTLNLKLTFVFGGATNSLVFPLKVTSCVANGDCDPGMPGNSAFDNLIMAFSDRNGIPPQLLKAQVEHESAFDQNAWRYEPLSYDWSVFHPDGTLTVKNSEQPWALAEGAAQCQTVIVPAGTAIGNDLGNPDVVSRQRLGIFTSTNGSPLCGVTEVPSPTTGRNIQANDSLVSMENILYANDACVTGTCLGYSVINSKSFVRFTESFQDTHSPFSAQTVLASSYGLHQLMYDTAVGMGYKGSDKSGLPPHSLFDPFTSLDLGSRYLALKFQDNDGSEDIDFLDFSHFLFQYGPALRGFNGGQLGFDEILSKCGNTVYIAAPPSAGPKEKSFDYPCLILQRTPQFTPKSLTFSSGGN
jgi:hypothetical protein